MIYDCFSFFNELDLLEIRLNVLKDVADKFVLVEATKTHTGKPKPLYYSENRARFAAFADKIIHIVVDDFPEPPADYTERQTSWMRENFQRNAIMRGLVGAKPDDLIIISDLDEIPRPELLTRKSAWKGITVCEQLFINYFINYLDYVRPYWKGSRILRYAELLGKPRAVKPHFAFIESVNKEMTPTRVRLTKADKTIHSAGWHFSYLGGIRSIMQKIKSVGIEYEERYNLSEAEVADMINSGNGITGNGGMYFAIRRYERVLPEFVIQHQSAYQHLFFSPQDYYWKRTRLLRIRCLMRGWIRRNGIRLIPSFLKPMLFRIYCKVVKNPMNQ